VNRLSILIFIISATIFGCSSETSNQRKNTDAQCLRVSYMDLWDVLDKRHVIVWLRLEPNGYLISLKNDLPDPDSHDLRFVDYDANAKLCGYGGDKIMEPQYGYNQIPATIESVKQLDDNELTELGKQYNKNLFRNEKPKSN